MLKEKLDEATDKLFYISESDAPVKPFTGGRAEAVTSGNLLKEIKTGSKNGSIEEITPAEFFEPLTKLRAGASAQETEYAERFDKIKNMLDENLRDVKVFKVGDDYQKKVYIVGLDEEGNLTGVQTEATET
ncbi:MAG: nuclease A inhibitor family protein [Aridibacter sp.]